MTSNIFMLPNEPQLKATLPEPGVDQARLADVVATPCDDRCGGGPAGTEGLVSRNVSERDKRARVLTLTPEGSALLARLAPLVEDLQREILSGLKDHEYRQFIELAAEAAAVAGALGED
jgi:hypothetical protein